jgi:glucosylceramidase
MSLQNEPKAAQTWDSCVYSAQEEKEFLRDFLYPALKRHGLDQVEVFIWDHNKERLFERAREVIDEETAAMVAGLAYHWYSGDHFDALDLVRQQYPDKKLILSESCLEFSKFDKSMEEKNAQRLAHDMIGNLNHGMDAFYDWNILLNGQGGPNHVDNFCDAPYLYHEDTGELENRRILECYWHFAHFIKPGAVRLATTKYTGELEITAWRNPDGRIIAVVLNTSDCELPCVLRMNGEMACFVAGPGSIMSAVIDGF